MEELGMTDLQFKAFLRGIIADLEEVKANTESSSSACKLIEKLIERYSKALED